MHHENILSGVVDLCMASINKLPYEEKLEKVQRRITFLTNRLAPQPMEAKQMKTAYCGPHRLLIPVHVRA